MKLEIFSTADQANAAAADCLAEWLTNPETRTLMVAAGNTPLDLYRRIAGRRLSLERLYVFALDEYVGVPLDEPRNCANLIRRSVADAWRVPPAQFFTVSSLEADALESVQAHERHIRERGGLEVTVLGLGQNGHLGFNEPGSGADSVGRVLELEAVSVEANRKWFDGNYGPARGVTVGLKTILSSKHILLLAYGPHKAAAAHAMARGPQTDRCPASFLQRHPDVRVFLDEAAGETCWRDHERTF